MPRLLIIPDLLILLSTVLRLAVAFALGTLIGFERQWRQHTAGLRTNVLVAIGAAAFADLGLRLAGTDGATRIIAYMVSGIGFLGAGVILKDGTSIRGPEHGGDAVVLGRGGRVLRRRPAGGGGRGDRVRAGRQHAAAPAGELGEPPPAR